MTAKKKSAPPKFEGELAKPILARLPNGGDLFSDGVLLVRIRKMTALAKHYEVEPGDWFELAYKMACDLVPGLQVFYDDVRARATQKDPKTRAAVADLPVWYGNGTKPKGSGPIPEWLDGDMLTWIFGLFKQKFPKDNDIAIADRIVLLMDESLASAAHETE
jgi:hypothetical protein